jgi:hypothetical protein
MKNLITLTFAICALAVCVAALTRYGAEQFDPTAHSVWEQRLPAPYDA